MGVVIRRKKKDPRKKAKVTVKRKKADTKAKVTVRRKKEKAKGDTEPKRKVKSNRVKPRSDIPLEAWKPVNEFNETIRQLGKGKRREYNRRTYFGLFGQYPPSGVPGYLIELRNGYETQFRGFYDAGCGDKLSPGFLKRYQASQKFDLMAWPADSRKLIEIVYRVKPSLRGVQRSHERKTDMAREKGVNMGLGVQETWVFLFQRNENPGLKKEDRLSDEAIRQAMAEEFPSRSPDEFKVSAFRSRYNRGLMTKGVVPKQKSHPYDDDGNKILNPRGGRRPASDAPKASGTFKKTGGTVRAASGAAQHAGDSSSGLTLAPKAGHIGISMVFPNGEAFTFTVPIKMVAQADTGVVKGGPRSGRGQTGRGKAKTAPKKTTPAKKKAADTPKPKKPANPNWPKKVTVKKKRESKKTEDAS